MSALAHFSGSTFLVTHVSRRQRIACSRRTLYAPSRGYSPRIPLATAAVQSIRITRIVKWLVFVTAATTLDASIIDNVIPCLAFSSG